MIKLNSSLSVTLLALGLMLWTCIFTTVAFGVKKQAKPFEMVRCTVTEITATTAILNCTDFNELEIPFSEWPEQWNPVKAVEKDSKYWFKKTIDTSEPVTNVMAQKLLRIRQQRIRCEMGAARCKR